MTENTLKIELKNLGISSKAHGISNIVTAKNNIIRITWIICFIASLTYCLYQLALCILSYLDYGVITNYEYIYEIPTQFPAVGICNLNPYDGNIIETTMSEINNKSIYTNISNQTYFIENLNSITTLFKTYFEKKSENNSMLKWFNSFWMEQMLISCQFNNHPCFFTDFMYYHNFYYGDCYSFNIGIFSNYSSVPYHVFNSTNYLNIPGYYVPFPDGPADIKHSQQAGSDYGLQLELYVGDPVNQIKYTHSSGIRVLIHNQTAEPVPEELGINCNPGVETNIAVSRLFIDHLSLPYNDCIEELNNENFQRNTVFYTLKTKMNKTNYNQAFCLKVCTQLFIIDKCGCFDFSLPKINDSQVQSCYSNSDFTCIGDKKNELFRNFNSACDVNCPIECHQKIYDVSLSSANYPTDWYAQKLIEDNGHYLQKVILLNQLNYSKLNSDYLKKTTLKVNVFYESLVYTHVFETPALTISSLIAFLGGNLGLFLGVSLLSLIEAIEVSYHIIIHLIQKGIDSYRNKFRDIKK